MLGLISRVTCVVAIAWGLMAARASAQERLDSSARVWADITFYRGTILLEGLEAVSVTPALRAEVELHPLQLGLDIPTAIGVTNVSSDLAPVGSGVGARLLSPTLHLDYLVEQRPLRMAVGLALAVPTNEGDGGSSSDLAAGAGAFGGLMVRGLWNIWWYLEDAWALIVPASVDSTRDDHELGFEGALAWILPNEDDRENSGVLQLAAHAAAIVDPMLIGVRLASVFTLDRRLFGSDQLQLSTELYTELRLPPGWLAAGLSIPLDEPLGVLGDGAASWGVRVAGGAGF